MLPKSWIGWKNILLGKTGEDIAEVFLKKIRLRVLERNFRTPFGEIDLVASDKNILVFVEVKTRISKNFGPPHLSITGPKKKKIIQNVLFYLYKRGMFDVPARIDVISINLNVSGKFEKLTHFRNAVTLDDR